MLTSRIAVGKACDASVALTQVGTGEDGQLFNGYVKLHDLRLGPSRKWRQRERDILTGMTEKEGDKDWQETERIAFSVVLV